MTTIGGDRYAHVVPATYQGRRFRSTTEARWAVLLTALGLDFEYEPETYDLGPLGWYLPDFWLPGPAMFIEVKSSGREPDRSELAKVRALAEVTDRRVALAHGFGAPRDYEFYGIPSFSGTPSFLGGNDEDLPGALEVYRRGGRVSGTALYLCRCGFVGLEWDRHWVTHASDEKIGDVPRMQRAYDDALAYRPDRR